MKFNLSVQPAAEDATGEFTVVLEIGGWYFTHGQRTLTHKAARQNRDNFAKILMAENLSVTVK